MKTVTWIITISESGTRKWCSTGLRNCSARCHGVAGAVSAWRRRTCWGYAGKHARLSGEANLKVGDVIRSDDDEGIITLFHRSEVHSTRSKPGDSVTICRKGYLKLA